jgi:hypothetical protein
MVSQNERRGALTKSGVSGDTLSSLRLISSNAFRLLRDCSGDGSRHERDLGSLISEKRKSAQTL